MRTIDIDYLEGWSSGTPYAFVPLQFAGGSLVGDWVHAVSVRQKCCFTGRVVERGEDRVVVWLDYGDETEWPEWENE